MLAAIPMALWHHSNDPADRQRLEELRKAVGYDWRTVRSFRSKEEAGHEEPWFAYLAGDNPDYPEMILSAAQAQVRHRLARMRAYRRPGLQHRPAGHRRRPGQPHPEHDRTVIVQAGAFAEHTLQAVRYTACPDRSWLGGLYDYGHREPAVTEHHAEVHAPWLTVRLPASTRVRLTLTLALRTRPRRTPRHSAGILGSRAKPRQIRQRPGSLVPRSVRNRSIHPNGPWCEPRSWF
jgi:hypothetical protein